MWSAAKKVLLGNDWNKIDGCNLFEKRILKCWAQNSANLCPRVSGRIFVESKIEKLYWFWSKVKKHKVVKVESCNCVWGFHISSKYNMS